MDRYQLENLAQAGHKSFVECVKRGQFPEWKNLAVEYERLPQDIVDFYALVAGAVDEHLSKNMPPSTLPFAAHQAFLADYAAKRRTDQPQLAVPFEAMHPQLRQMMWAFYQMLTDAMSTCAKKQDEGAWAQGGDAWSGAKAW